MSVSSAIGRQVMEAIPGLSVEVIDSGTATIAQGLIVSAVARASERGESLAEIVKAAKQVAARVKLAGVLDTI
jgi:fatty acid-binding protein DegV